MYEAAKLALANGEIDFDNHSFKINLYLSTANLAVILPPDAVQTGLVVSSMVIVPELLAVVIVTALVSCV